jgi:hypothetical protein
MTSERVASGTKVALLGAALALLIAACGEQAPEEETEQQGGAPTSQESTVADAVDAGPATGREQQQQ